MQRLLAAAAAATLAIAIAACSPDTLSHEPDAGTSASLDATASDAASADGANADAANADAALDADAGCSALDPTSAPEVPAALTGRLDITDYDTFDDIFTHARARTRQAGFNFYTQTLGVQPLSDGALFTALEADHCVAFDLDPPHTDLRPARNVGTGLTLMNEAGTVSVAWIREPDADGPRYRLATQDDTIRFFDRAITKLDDTWTWSSPGDATANIGAASAHVDPVEDFEVTPAFTATTAPAALDPAGATIRWTAPAASSRAVMSIALARLLDATTGSARYLVCRPVDDGEYAISAADLTAFGPTPGLAFDFAVARTSMGALCNEGTLGAAIHTLVYFGSAVVN